MGLFDSLSRFAGNLTGGFIGDSDEERRRRQQQQAQKAAARPSPLRPVNAPRPSAARPAQQARQVSQQIRQQKNPASVLAAPTPQEEEEQQVGFDVLADGSPVKQPRIQPQTIPRMDTDDLTQAPNIITRQNAIRQGIKENKEISDIADSIGLAENEVQSFVDTEAKGYKAKNFMQQVGALGSQVGQSIVNTIGAPGATIASLANPGAIDKQVNFLNDEYKAGRISGARLKQEFDKVTQGQIGYKLKVGDAGVEKKSNLEDITNFAGHFAETGVNAFPGASGVATGVAKNVAKESFGNLVKQAATRSAQESAFTGTVGIAADAAQDRGISVESVLLNYGGDFLFNAGGEISVTGIKKMVSGMKADPNITPDMMKQILSDTIAADVTKKITPKELEAILTVKPDPKLVKPIEAPVQAKPGTLDPNAQLAAIKARMENPIDAPRPENPNAAIAAVPVDQYLPRLAEKFNLQPATANRLLNRYKGDQASLHAILEANADKIARADIPDAYATKIVNEAITAGQTAAVKGGVAPGREKMPGQEQLLDMGFDPATHQRQKDGSVVNTETGEIVKDAPAKATEKLYAPGSKIVDGARVSVNSREVRNANKKEFTVEDPSDGEKFTVTIKENNHGDLMVERSYADGTFIETKKVSSMQEPGENLTPEQLAERSVYGNGKIVKDGPVDNSSTKVESAPVISDTKLNDTSVKSLKESEKANPIESPKEVEPKSVAQETAAELKAAYKREQKVWKAIDEGLEAAGFDPTDIRQKIAKTARKEYTPTTEEKAAFSIIKSELDSARSELAKKGIEFKGEIESYRPEVKAGTLNTTGKMSREELQNFGYSKRRNDKIDLQDQDYSANPEIDYTFKARNRDLEMQDAIARAAETDGRTITREQVNEAAAQTIAIQDKVKKAASKSQGVLNNDTVADYNKVGEAEGYTIEENTTKIGWAAQEPKNILERAGVYKKGFEQYYNSAGYAHELVDAVDNADIDLALAMPTALKKAFPDADQSSIASISTWLERRLEEATPEQRVPLAAAAFRMGAKAELTKMAKTTTFANKKLNKVVNEQLNAVLINDAYKRNLLSKLDDFVTHRINESLRGANVVSAMFEASDFYNIAADFGVKNLGKSKVGFGKIDGDYYGMSARYGKTNQHFLSNDVSEQAGKLDKIWTDPNTNIGQKMYQSARNVRDKTLLFGYVERWKTELFLREADTFYRAKGLKGKELVDTVNAHFDKTMLPSTILTTNRLLGKSPKFLTQYLSWGINSTKRLGRTVSGSNEYGKFAGLGRAERVMRGVGAEIVPKVVTAMALGVPITQVLGGRDWFGVSTGDYSGIEEEDRQLLDDVVNTLAMSPALGMMANFYNGYRVNQEAQEEIDAGEKDVKIDSKWVETAAKKSGEMTIPFNAQYKKAFGFNDGMKAGVFKNADGRIQYEAPTSLGEIFMGYVAGKSHTQTARDYSDNPNLQSVVEGKASLVDLATHNQTVDNVKQAIGGETNRDYTRPLSTSTYDKGYNQQAIEAYEAAIKAHGKDSDQAKKTMKDWIGLGRQYNKVFDDFKKKNPEDFKIWQDSMNNDDMLTPEKWQMYRGNQEVFDFMKKRKQLEARDLGRPVDPVFSDKFTDEQRKMVLQHRAAHTGEDMRLQEFMYKQPWYQSFKDAEGEYYKSFESEQDLSGKSQRVKDHKRLGDELYAAKDKYALVAENKRLLEEHGFGSETAKAWFKVHGEVYKAQKLEYEKHRFDIVNQMRRLEGVAPLTHEEWMAKIDFPEQDETGQWFGGKYGDKFTPWAKRSRGGGSGSGSDEIRTGAEATITRFSADNSGIKEVNPAPKKLVDSRKAFKQYKRASGQSPIRIKI